MRRGGREKSENDLENGRGGTLRRKSIDAPSIIRRTVLNVSDEDEPSQNWYPPQKGSQIYRQN